MPEQHGSMLSLTTHFIMSAPLNTSSHPAGSSPAGSSPTRSGQLWWHRQKMGYSQWTVAQLLGHQTTAHVCAYERGKRTPTLRTALKLSIVLCVPVEFLYPALYQQLKRTIHQRKQQLQHAQRPQALKQAGNSNQPGSSPPPRSA